MTPERPPWAKAAIIAELEENTSDIQSDYFGSRTLRTVILGWSSHTKDLFPEMRKAAALFPETAHLGPGKDRYTPRVVLAVDVPFEKAHSGGHYKGSRSHWHTDLYGDDIDPPVFTTREEAEAFIATKGQPHPISFDGFEATFEWQVGVESVEHREKWSMGHGYYLGYSKYSGWQVRKTLPDVKGELAPHLLTEEPAETPAPKAQEAPTGVTLTVNREKNGVELRFPSKPPDAVRDQLKSNGWRWSRFSSCWYTKDTPGARAFAASLAGAGTETVPEGTKNIPAAAAESCQFHFPKRCPSGCPYRGDRFSERQVKGGSTNEPSVSHIVIGGKDYFRNTAGRCEDAPCCGCCSI